MRMSSFIVGGIMGAAAVVYLNRNNKQMTFSFGQAGETMNKLVGTAANKMMGMNMKNTSSNENGLDKVEKIAKEDPQIQRQVDEILKENQEKTFQTQ